MENKDKLMSVMFIIIIAGFLFVMKKSSLSTSHNSEHKINELESQIDSLNNLYRVYEDSLSEQRKISETLIISIDSLSGVNKNIKAKYEKIRNDVSVMSLDEHIDFISTAISKKDSLSR